MPSFDITSILDFDPARYACPVCRGLIGSIKVERQKTSDGKYRTRFLCGICGVEFLWSEHAPKGRNVYNWFQEQGSSISLGPELFDHARVLAKLVKDSRDDSWGQPWPTMRLLFETLSRAKSFVHFASWGISHQLVGVLKLTSMRVPVYGFVTSADREITRELTGFPQETPRLNAQVISPRTGNFEAPHQTRIRE